MFKLENKVYILKTLNACIEMRKNGCTSLNRAKTRMTAVNGKQFRCPLNKSPYWGQERAMLEGSFVVVCVHVYLCVCACVRACP